MLPENISKFFWANLGRKFLSIGQNRSPSVAGDPITVFAKDLKDVLERIGRPVRTQSRTQGGARFKVKASSSPRVGRHGGLVAM
jgi:hypothetical protein